MTLPLSYQDFQCDRARCEYLLSDPIINIFSIDEVRNIQKTMVGEDWHSHPHWYIEGRFRQLHAIKYGHWRELEQVDVRK
jgi:hypothetical protein